MADVAGGDHEDHVFGDVGGVVADAFQVPRDQDQIERRLDRRGILKHVGQQLAEDLRLERVELVVFIEHALRERRVAADECVERVAQHALRDHRHLGDVDQPLDRRVDRVAKRRLGDVDRQVADALEVGVDLHSRDDRAKIHGHRLIERQQREAALIDLDVQRIDWLVADQHAFDAAAIAGNQTLDGKTHLFFREPTHFEQPRLEMFELLLKMPDAFGTRHYPNRPVT